MLLQRAALGVVRVQLQDLSNLLRGQCQRAFRHALPGGLQALMDQPLALRKALRLRQQLVSLGAGGIQFESLSASDCAS